MLRQRIHTYGSPFPSLYFIRCRNAEKDVKHLRSIVNIIPCIDTCYLKPILILFFAATINCDDAVRANDPAWIFVPLLAAGGGQVDGIHLMEHYYSYSRQPMMRLRTGCLLYMS